MIDSSRMILAVGCSLIMLMITGYAIDFVFIGTYPLSPNGRLGVTLVLLWLATRSQVVLLFSILVASWLFRESTKPGAFAWTSGVAMVILSIGLMAWISRYQLNRRRLFEWFLHLNQDKPDQEYGFPLGSIVRSVFALAQIVIVAVGAACVFRNQPWSTYEESWFRWSVQNQEVLWPGPVIVTLVIGLLVFLNEVAWRQKLPAQKRLFLRTEAAKILHPDLRRVVQRMLKRS
jgi:hypothetical protein